MRLLQFLPAVLSLASLAVAATDKTANLLKKINKSKGYIVLNDEIFPDLINSPRDYSALVLMTALDSRFQCHMCKEFQPEFDLVSYSWAQASGKEEQETLLIGFADFNNAKKTFQKLGITSAPVMFLFPPTTGPNAVSPNAQPIKYEFSAQTVGADAVARFVKQHTGKEFQIVRPFNYAKLFTTIAVVVGGIATVTVGYPLVLPVLQSRKLWAAFTLVAILLFTSGHMFNHIRKVPYMAQDRQGNIMYIAAGFSTQYGVESQIVAACYALMAFCVINLGMRVPQIAQEGRQTLAVWVWSAVLAFVFSFLISVFRAKNNTYPFFLPPFGK